MTSVRDDERRMTRPSVPPHPSVHPSVRPRPSVARKARARRPTESALDSRLSTLGADGPMDRWTVGRTDGVGRTDRRGDGRSDPSCSPPSRSGSPATAAASRAHFAIRRAAHSAARVLRVQLSEVRQAGRGAARRRAAARPGAGEYDARSLAVRRSRGDRPSVENTISAGPRRAPRPGAARLTAARGRAASGEPSPSRSVVSLNLPGARERKSSRRGRRFREQNRRTPTGSSEKSRERKRENVSRHRCSLYG